MVFEPAQATTPSSFTFLFLLYFDNVDGIASKRAYSTALGCQRYNRCYGPGWFGHRHVRFPNISQRIFSLSAVAIQFVWDRTVTGAGVLAQQQAGSLVHEACRELLNMPLASLHVLKSFTGLYSVVGC
jgi:hypothetical protein